MLCGIATPGKSRTFSRRACQEAAFSGRALHSATRCWGFCARIKATAVPHAPEPRIANRVVMRLLLQASGIGGSLLIGAWFTPRAGFLTPEPWLLAYLLQAL